ncbi:serine--tRNA ligase [Candidatus Babeliales bacterium]|nr:serine--tRNA ligase [Candidatus Babeliales bacterium]
MIDLSKLRQDTQNVKILILRKEPGFAVDTLIQLDQQVRSIRSDVEQLRKEKNDLAKQGAQGVSAEVRERAIQLGKDLKAKELELEATEKEFNNLWLCCPNIPQEDIPVGDKADNKVVKTVGQKPNFSFKPKNHLELNEQAQWFDLHVGANIAGAQFVFYNECGTKIIYALTSLMLRNNVKHGFKPVLPPALIQEKGLYNAGNLPKFEGDFYRVNDENLCLIPTSEVSLTNLHADQIIPGEQLPLRYTSWTSCFRREAGGHGANDRGLIRIHQFEKVELFAITKPEDSNPELDRMVAAAEDILQQLGLHYRISLLAAQDCSFQSSKTFDIEVWLPGQDRFYEVSSCSNCHDFQARRAGIRYRAKAEEKPTLVHTLNASSLALPRLMVALMETYQQEDGSIKLPEHVQKLIDNVW